MSNVTRRLTNKQPVDPIRRLFEDLNQPSEARLKQALRARQIPFTDEEVANIVKGSTAKQVFAPRPRADGKVVSTHKNARWAADLVDMTATPTKDGQKYILVVQDIFSRQIHAIALTTKIPSAAATAMRIIIGDAGTPERLTTDRGSEFRDGAFPRLLNEKGILHQTKDPRDLNAIATLDKAIQELRKGLAKGGDMERWHERLTRVVRGMNASPHPHLMGSAPKDVNGENKVLEFGLSKKAAFDLQHNDDIIRARDKKLEAAGAYRAQEPWQKFERSFKPRFGDKVHQVATVEGGIVTDTQGKKEAVKLVRPVPRGSTDARPGQFVRRGSAQVEVKKRALLETYAKKVVRHIGRGNEMELWRVGVFIKTQRGFNDRAREAGINMKSKIANFLRAFPELFTVQTTMDGGTVTVTA